MDDLQELLAEVLGDDSAPKKPHAKGPPTPPNKAPPSVKAAITDVAIEAFDPELLQVAATIETEDEALSSIDEKPAPKPTKRGKRDKVTQGVTPPIAGKAPSFKGKRASAESAAGVTKEDERAKAVSDLSIPMPKFTSKELAASFDIRNFATLVRLETARWHAKAKDKGAAADVAKANEADETAFVVQKNLLAGADEALQRIHKALDKARAKHYELTLPWTTKKIDDTGRRSGSRLLPNTLFFEYTKEMATCKDEMVAALEAFVPAYPELIKQAKKKLGQRFNPAEYPNADSIRQHFDLSFDFQPIPAGDDFKGLPDQQLNALANSINRKTEQMMEGAMQDVWVRLYEAVSHMAERLGSPDKSFHYTLVDNVREVTRLLKHLNVTQDKNVERIRLLLDKHVTPHDAQELREKAELRTRVGGHCKSIVDAMNKLGGAKKA